MERFSTAQQVLIVKTFYEKGECAMQTVRKLPTILTIDKVCNNCFCCNGEIAWAETFLSNWGAACSCARQCHCESRKINLPTFSAVEYSDHVIASNFALHIRL